MPNEDLSAENVDDISIDLWIDPAVLGVEVTSLTWPAPNQALFPD